MRFGAVGVAGDGCCTRTLFVGGAPPVSGASLSPMPKISVKLQGVPLSRLPLPRSQGEASVISISASSAMSDGDAGGESGTLVRAREPERVVPLWARVPAEEFRWEAITDLYASCPRSLYNGLAFTAVCGVGYTLPLFFSCIWRELEHLCTIQLRSFEFDLALFNTATVVVNQSDFVNKKNRVLIDDLSVKKACTSFGFSTGVPLCRRFEF